MTTVGQGGYWWGVTTGIASPCPRCCAKSQRHLWQPVVNVSTGFSRVSYWLLPAPAAVSTCLMRVWGCHQNPDPGFHQYEYWLLDYYNSLYSGIADGLMSRLQSVQNAAAHLITGVRQCEHISCTSYQSADEWISRYPPLSIVRWLAPLLCT